MCAHCKIDGGFLRWDAFSPCSDPEWREESIGTRAHHERIVDFGLGRVLTFFSLRMEGGMSTGRFAHRKRGAGFLDCDAFSPCAHHE